jgi:hypothetical protein
MFEHMVKGLDVKTEAIQEVLRGLQVYVNMLLETEAKKLHAKSFNGSSDPEQEARLLHAIKLFMGLIEKGAELCPSLKASESVKSSFPDFSKLSSMKPATEVIQAAKSSAAVTSRVCSRVERPSRTFSNADHAQRLHALARWPLCRFLRAGAFDDQLADFIGHGHGFDDGQASRSSRNSCSVRSRGRGGARAPSKIVGINAQVLNILSG